MFKKRLLFQILFFIGYALSMSMMSCSKNPDRVESSKLRVNFNIREGKRFFLHYCSPCHGENADGAGRYYPSYMEPQPPDFLNSDYLRETGEDTIFKAIKSGSKSLGKSNHSPPYGNTLRDEEIKYIIEYLKFLKQDRGEKHSLIT